MSSQGWRCHNDAPVVVTIVDASDVKTSEVESAATTRFYNCEVRAALASRASWRELALIIEL